MRKFSIIRNASNDNSETDNFFQTDRKKEKKEENFLPDVSLNSKITQMLRWIPGEFVIAPRILDE